MKKKILFIAFTLVLGMFVMPNVYAVEETEVRSWTDLKGCLEADDGKTCKVVSEINDSSGTYILVKHDKVLNLQSFTVNMPNTIYDYSKLTITGTGGKLVGPATSPAGLMVMVANKGTLDIDNATLQANAACDGVTCEGQVISIAGVDNHVTIGKDATLIGGYGVMFQYFSDGVHDEDNKKVGANGSVLDVYGTIKASDKGGMGITIKGDITGGNHIISNNPPVVNIYDGSQVIAKESAAIYGAGYGIWNINGGYIEGDEALSIKSGVFNVAGGTLKAVGTYVETPTAEPSAKESTGAAISITSNNGFDGHIKVNISGNPKIISENGNAIYEGITNDDKSEVEEIAVTGGEFQSAEELPAVVISEAFNESHESGFISGGTFLSGNTPSNIVAYLVEGLQQDENGNVVVPVQEEEKNPDTADTNVYGLLTIILVSGLGLGYVIRKRMN